MSDDFYFNGLMKIAHDYEASFKKDTNAFKALVRGAESPALIGGHIYIAMVNRKLLSPIESLSPELKLELWNEAKAWCPGARKEKLINVSKLIWTIENILT